VYSAVQEIADSEPKGPETRHFSKSGATPRTLGAKSTRRTPRKMPGIGIDLSKLTPQQQLEAAHLEKVGDGEWRHQPNLVNDEAVDGLSRADYPEIDEEAYLKVRISDKLNARQQVAVELLVKEYKGIFGGEPPLEPCPGFEHKIDLLPDAKPFYRTPYRISAVERASVKKDLDKLLERNVIESTTSAWGSPMLLVRKKSGGVRIVIDYRELNKQSIKQSWPIPRIDQSLDSLAGSYFFSSLDCCKGFWSLKMKESCRDLTAFTTPFGVYRFKRLPMGLKSAAEVYQRYMDYTMRGLSYKCVCVYLDDLVVHSRSFDQHLVDLKDVFERVKKAGLVLGPEKCLIAANEIHFLGYIVSSQGTLPDPQKTLSISEMDSPTDVSGVRRFLGMVGYFRRSIEDIASIAVPLYRLCRKDVDFLWDEKCQKAFDTLKQKLIEAPILRHPIDGEPYVIRTDACHNGAAAILLQGDGVVAYESKTFTNQQIKWSTRDKESFAIIFGVRKFRAYIAGTHFTIETDHQNLIYLLAARKGRVGRYALELEGLSFTTQHISGKSNVIADTISRAPLKTTEETVFVAINQGAKAIHGLAARIPGVALNAATRDMILAQERVPFLNAMKFWCTNRKFPREAKMKREVEAGITDYVVAANNALYKLVDIRGEKGFRLVIPREMQQEVLIFAHDSAAGAHWSFSKTYNRLLDRVTWKTIKRDVRLWTRTCEECILSRARFDARSGDLRPIYASEPGELWHCDSFGPLSKSGARQFNHVLVFVDAFSRIHVLEPVTDRTAATVAEVLIRRIVCVYGVPKRLVLDGAPGFVSEVLGRVCEGLGTQRYIITSYNPCSNGKCEIQVKWIKNKLRTMIRNHHHKNWHLWLPIIAFSYSTAVLAGGDYSPHFLTFGKNARLPMDAAFGIENEMKGPRLLPDDFGRHMIELWSQWGETQRVNGQKAEKMYNDNQKVQRKTFAVGEKCFAFNPQPPQTLNKLQKHQITRAIGPFDVLCDRKNGEYDVRDLTKINPQITVLNQKRMIKSSLWNRVKQGIDDSGRRAARYPNSWDDGDDCNMLQRIAEKLDATFQGDPSMQHGKPDFLAKPDKTQLYEPHPIELTPEEELEDLTELSQKAREKLNGDLLNTYETYKKAAEFRSEQWKRREKARERNRLAIRARELKAYEKDRADHGYIMLLDPFNEENQALRTKVEWSNGAMLLATVDTGSSLNLISRTLAFKLQAVSAMTSGQKKPRIKRLQDPRIIFSGDGVADFIFEHITADIHLTTTTDGKSKAIHTEFYVLNTDPSEFLVLGTPFLRKIRADISWGANDSVPDADVNKTRFRCRTWLSSENQEKVQPNYAYDKGDRWQV